MTEIVIISGKGGTGKTSVTAALAFLSEKPLVVADCDVDAADMHILLHPDFLSQEDFFSGSFASIDSGKCIACNLCAQVCRFNAINIVNGEYMVRKIDCEGCGYCSRVCPENAIEMIPNHTGLLFCSNTRLDNILVHAELTIGAENSGKLVSRVRQKAKAVAEKSQINNILVDGSPGIGCPVIASITGADLVVVVTEPTVSGLHDLERVIQLASSMGINTSCIINKWDLNVEKTNEIEKFLKEKEISLLGKLPYHKAFNLALNKKLTVGEIKEGKEISEVLKEIWNKINLKTK
ncbi:MAG: ATP-binding protein [Bacteroidales bacterium]|nr:ATP-binding protein [Bacteroidales bacterium]